MSDQPSVWNKQHRSTDMDTGGEDAEYVSFELKGLRDMRRALAEGADPDERGALLEAVDRGSVSQVNALLKAGARTDQFYEDGYTPLHLAVLNLSPAKVNALLKAGADVNALVPHQIQHVVDGETFIGRTDQPGQSAAMMAARQGDRAMIEQLRQHGASLDGVLHAALIGDLEKARQDETRIGPFRPHGPLVPRLLAEGWDPNLVHDVDCRVFRSAGNPGSRLNLEGATPLHIASLIGTDLTSIDVLIDAGGDPNFADIDGCTPLHKASTSLIARRLLDAGGDPNQADNKGNTSVHYAAHGFSLHHSIDVVIEAGGDPNRANHQGDTPLHLAASPFIAQRLLDAGGDPLIKNREAEDAREANSHRMAVSSVYANHLLNAVAQASRPPEELASVEEVQARSRSRGQLM